MKRIEILLYHLWHVSIPFIKVRKLIRKYAGCSQKLFTFLVGLNSLIIFSLAYECISKPGNCIHPGRKLIYSNLVRRKGTFVITYSFLYIPKGHQHAEIIRLQSHLGSDLTFGCFILPKSKQAFYVFIEVGEVVGLL